MNDPITQQMVEAHKEITPPEEIIVTQDEQLVGDEKKRVN